jgi:hypothetical protein
MRTELVFTAFDRPEYLAQTLDTWNDVRGLASIPASFFIEPSDLVDSVAELAFTLRTSTTVNINETVQGVLVNPWNALDSAFGNGAEFVILAEDDVVVSQDTLEFFNWASVEYQTTDVLAVNACSSLGGGRDNEVYTDAGFNPLVWGTWTDRWYNVLRDTWDKDYSTGNPDGSEAGWDWNINRIIQAGDWRVVRPVNSRSNHIGEFNGTHTTPESFPGSQSISYKQIRGRQRYREI